MVGMRQMKIWWPIISCFGEDDKMDPVYIPLQWLGWVLSLDTQCNATSIYWYFPEGRLLTPFWNNVNMAFAPRGWPPHLPICLVFVLRCIWTTGLHFAWSLFVMPVSFFGLNTFIFFLACGWFLVVGPFSLHSFLDFSDSLKQAKLEKCSTNTCFWCGGDAVLPVRTYTYWKSLKTPRGVIQEGHNLERCWFWWITRDIWSGSVFKKIS